MANNGTKRNIETALFGSVRLGSVRCGSVWFGAAHAQRFHMKNISLSRCAAESRSRSRSCHLAVASCQLPVSSRRQVHEIYGKRQPSRARDCSLLLAWSGLGLPRLSLAKCEFSHPWWSFQLNFIGFQIEAARQSDSQTVAHWSPDCRVWFCVCVLTIFFLVFWVPQIFASHCCGKCWKWALRHQPNTHLASHRPSNIELLPFAHLQSDFLWQFNARSATWQMQL